jgi:hypothetical protein
MGNPYRSPQHDPTEVEKRERPEELDRGDRYDGVRWFIMVRTIAHVQILLKSRNRSSAPEQERMQGDNADQRAALGFRMDDGQLGG